MFVENFFPNICVVFYLSDNNCLMHCLLKQVAESKLAKFVEDIVVPPRMVDILVDGEVFLIFFPLPFYLDKGMDSDADM